MSEVIDNVGNGSFLEIRDRMPEYTVALNQNDNWEVEVYDAVVEQKRNFTFAYPPTPNDILKALNG